MEGPCKYCCGFHRSHDCDDLVAIGKYRGRLRAMDLAETCPPPRPAMKPAQDMNVLRELYKLNENATRLAKAMESMLKSQVHTADLLAILVEGRKEQDLAFYDWKKEWEAYKDLARISKPEWAPLNPNKHETLRYHTEPSDDSIHCNR